MFNNIYTKLKVLLAVGILAVLIVLSLLLAHENVTCLITSLNVFASSIIVYTVLETIRIDDSNGIILVILQEKMSKSEDQIDQ